MYRLGAVLLFLETLCRSGAQAHRYTVKIAAGDLIQNISSFLCLPASISSFSVAFFAVKLASKVSEQSGFYYR